MCAHMQHYLYIVFIYILIYVCMLYRYTCVLYILCHSLRLSFSPRSQDSHLYSLYLLLLAIKTSLPATAVSLHPFSNLLLLTAEALHFMVSLRISSQHICFQSEWFVIY